MTEKIMKMFLLSLFVVAALFSQGFCYINSTFDNETPSVDNQLQDDLPYCIVAGTGATLKACKMSSNDYDAEREKRIIDTIGQQFSESGHSTLKLMAKMGIQTEINEKKIDELEIKLISTLNYSEKTTKKQISELQQILLTNLTDSVERQISECKQHFNISNSQASCKQELDVQKQDCDEKLDKNNKTLNENKNVILEKEKLNQLLQTNLKTALTKINELENVTESDFAAQFRRKHGNTLDTYAVWGISIHIYKGYEAVSHAEAVKKCRDLGMWLLKPYGGGMNHVTYLATPQGNPSSYTNFWTAGVKHGNWVWSDPNEPNEPFIFGHWGPHEPSGDGNCMAVYKFGYTAGEFRWNDAPCSARYGYMCQHPRIVRH